MSKKTNGPFLRAVCFYLSEAILFEATE